MSFIFILIHRLSVKHNNKNKYDWVILIMFYSALITEIKTAATITKIYNDSIIVNWDKSDEVLIKYNLTVDNLAYSNLNDNNMKMKIKKVEQFVQLEEQNPPLKIRNLYPGMSYQIELDVQLKSGKMKTLFAPFTVKPNVPRQLICCHDRNDLTVQWHRPENNPIFEKYRVQITADNWSGRPDLLDKDEIHWQFHFAKFSNLTRHKSYKAIVQTISGRQLSDPVEVICPVAPDPPSDVMVDPKTVTPHSFEIHWNPPKNDCEFDGYIVFVDTLIETNVSKGERLSLNVSDYIKPGKTYHISVVTVSVHFSQPKYVSVTTPPLPVLNITTTPGKSSDIFVDWSPQQNSSQDSYRVGYGPIELEYCSREIISKLNTHLIGLLPGYNYSIRVTAISKGIPSQTSLIVYQSTRPSKPIFFEFEPLFENDLNVSWSFNYNISKKEYFEIVWTRIDTNETRSEKNTQNNFTHINNVYPGAKYLFKIFAVKYSLASEPDLRYYTVEPRSPTEIKLVNSTDTSIFIEWISPKHSLVEYYIIKVCFSHRKTFQEYDKTTNNFYSFDNLKNANEYAIKVVSFSNGKESSEKGDADQIQLPLYSSILVMDRQSIGFTENFTKFVDQLIDKNFKIEPGREDSKSQFIWIAIIMIVLFLILLSFATFRIVNNLRKNKSELVQINLNRLDEDRALIENDAHNDHVAILPNIDECIRIEKIDLIIQDYIDEGHFGSVYSGLLHSRNGRIETRVAVKKLKFVPDQIQLDNYLQEAIIMKNFCHQNVLNLIGVSVDEDGSPLIVLPFMERGDLRSYLIDEENNPTVNQLLKFGFDVAKGMEYLSNKRLIHRDLAARNCMLDNNLCAKVADFGLTRDIYDKIYYKSNANEVLPIRWMSIESIEKLIYDTTTDVWSYGVLMWEVFTRGVKPYPDLIGNNEVLPYLKSGHRLERPDFCPKIIYEMLCLCWDIQSSHRPTFAQLSQRLEEILADPHNLLKFDEMYYNNPVIYSLAQL